MSTTDNIRCLALVGQGGAGKTTLAEALLYEAGAITARGAVEKGSTVADFDPLEKEAGHSMQSALLHLEHNGVRLHLVDTPGYPDFLAQSVAALDAVDTVLVVVDAQEGLAPVSERMLEWAAERGLCRMLVVNKIDAGDCELAALVADLRERFGPACRVLDLPRAGRAGVVEVLDAAGGASGESGATDFDSPAAAHRALIDQIVEEDEDLLARYLDDGQDPAASELHAPFEKALRSGHLLPVLFTSAKSGIGVAELLHVLETLAPHPGEGNPPPFFAGDPGRPDTTPYPIVADPQRHVVAHVFKLVADPYMGKVGIFRVHQGTVKKEMQLFVGDSKRPFKVAHLYRLQGKDYVETNELLPGELGAVAKVEEIFFDSVLHDAHEEDHIHLKPLDFPLPMHGLAVETLRKNDEQRLFDILAKLELEDPCFKVERHPTLNETVIRGLGELHLRAKLARLASQYKLELSTKPPRIPYRETITRPAEGHHRHKKQTGGAGQFGEVFLRIEPLARGEGFQFVDAVKGGAIPGTFMPAVEKGVRQALDDGVLAGFPVVDLKVTVYDGKSHSVDGKEVAFVAAGRKAAIAAIREASPIVLEPVVRLEVVAPEAAVGDVSGDLSARRAHLTGTGGRGPGRLAVRAEAPLAELADYPTRLKSLTGDQGSYTLEFSHYAQVPPNTQKDLAGRFKLHEEEE